MPVPKVSVLDRIDCNDKLVKKRCRFISLYIIFHIGVFIYGALSQENETGRKLSERFVRQEERTKFKNSCLNFIAGQDKLYLTRGMADPF